MWWGVSDLWMKWNLSWSKLRGSENKSWHYFVLQVPSWIQKQKPIQLLWKFIFQHCQTAVFPSAFTIVRCCSLWHDCLSHLHLYEKLCNRKTQLKCHFLLEVLVEFPSSWCSLHISYGDVLWPWLCCNILLCISLPNLNMNSLEAKKHVFLGLFIVHHSASVWTSDFKNMWMNKRTSELFVCHHTK